MFLSGSRKHSGTGPCPREGCLACWLCFGRESCGQFCEHDLCLVDVEVGLVALSDAVIGQQMVVGGGDVMTAKAIAHTGQRATVDGDDASARLRNPHQFGHVATDTGDAGHFGKAAPVKADGQIIRHLCRAGATRAGIDQGKIGARGHRRNTANFLVLHPSAQPGALSTDMLSQSRRCVPLRE